MDTPTLAHCFIHTIHRVSSPAPANITHADINARNVVQASSRRNGNKTPMLGRSSVNLAIVMDILIDASTTRKLMRSISLLMFEADTMAAEFVRIVVTILRASIVTSASRDSIDLMEDIGTKPTFVSHVIAIISTRQEIVLKRPDIANVALNSKLQTAIHVQRDISAFQTVVLASAIWMERLAIIAKRPKENVHAKRTLVVISAKNAPSVTTAIQTANLVTANWMEH